MLLAKSWASRTKEHISTVSLDGDAYKRLGLLSAGDKFVVPVTIDYTKYYSLLDMNDYHKMSFVEIAAYIRSNVSNVFVKDIHS